MPLQEALWPKWDTFRISMRELNKQDDSQVEEHWEN
jgi:hypothetical protein